MLVTVQETRHAAAQEQTGREHHARRGMDVRGVNMRAFEHTLSACVGRLGRSKPQNQLVFEVRS